MATLIARTGKIGKWVTVKFSPSGDPIKVLGATSYTIRYTENGKRTTEPAGDNLAEAIAMLRRRQALESGSVKLLQEFSENTTRTSPGRMPLSIAIENYLASILDDSEKEKIAKSSYTNYKLAVESFGEFCAVQGVQYLDQISGKVLLDHESWLRRTLPRRKADNGRPLNQLYTIATRFRNLNIFLAKNGIKMKKDRRMLPGDPGLLDHGKVTVAPKQSDRDPYEPEEVQMMLETAQAMADKNWQPQRDDKSDGGFLYRRDAQTAVDLIHFALKTGFRDGEIQHAEWDDIDWRRKTITTKPKPQYNFKTKNKKNRTVDIDTLVERLKRRQEEQTPRSNLIFHTELNTPDTNLIWYVQEVVKRMVSEGKRVKGRVSLHRFRYVYANDMFPALVQQGGNTASLRDALGHSSVAITEGYLRKNRGQQKKASQTAFGKYGD